MMNCSKFDCEAIIITNFEIFVCVCADETIHNLNEYMEIHASDELKNMEAGLINSVFTQKLGVVISENKLEEFFSQIS